jgi:hypothetical protein
VAEIDLRLFNEFESGCSYAETCRARGYDENSGLFRFQNNTRIAGPD